ncbi:kinesin-like protein CG14535 isoform X2 [Agrilus planipennis]|nr:kinesin-like protein CG14535 isoform X2 [Agrilus planipennis]XP_025830847.1 kinesin-like protein CG14535 isoform X2 [Agrilus planipennis]XP_025830848.1 kinesin-like protein CG14535 isoform X2 [Agrilus planipennis]
MESYRNRLGKRRSTPIPVLPPRIPTPMPPPNNNNIQKSGHVSAEATSKVHPMSGVGPDATKLISKGSYKLLDNDVKTAWINPRLISRLNMELIRSTEYIIPETKPMNGYNHNLYQKQQTCNRAHEKEWEPSVNGRAKPPPRYSAVSSLSQSIADAAASRTRDKTDRERTNKISRHQTDSFNTKATRFLEPAGKRIPPTEPSSIIPPTKQQQQSSMEPKHFKQRQPLELALLEKSAYDQRLSKHRTQTTNCGAVEKPQYARIPNSKVPVVQVKNKGHPKNATGKPGVAEPVGKVKSLVGYHESSVGYVGGALVGSEKEVFGVYAETRYAFAVNGLPGSVAQASAAAAFFARAAQKLNLSSSPHRKKRISSEDAEAAGFCGALQRAPPPVPPALLRRIGVKEVTGVGKVKVMLRVSTLPSGSSPENSNFFSIDKRKKQVTLIDPSVCGSSPAPEDRRVGVAAPKMFAFDALFSQDDSQTEVCSSALTDVIHAVINGTDGCLFCFGHAGLGKSYTMLGAPDNTNTLGIIPCAISWLFRGINEQKQKTGARFSVRVSAVEVCGPTNQLRDLLSSYSNDSEQSPGMYLRDDPLFGNQPPHCELRVPTAEKAAQYLDAAIEGRAPAKEDSRDSHLLFTLHVYQYSVAGKGGVAGGRSRLHLFDLGNSERGKSSGGIPLSGLGNILLAIFNGQKHLPYKDHKLTYLLKDCLSSLTCHAAMIAHVSPFAQNYSDTLTTVQLASRIHRMRRRKIKFVSAGVGNSSGGSSGEEAARTTGTSSEPDPSSSDLSADTVIYVGPADDATDCEHPPVYIPSLNSGDNRCSMSKALRGSGAEQRPGKPSLPQKSSSDEKTPTHRPSIKNPPGTRTSPAHSGNQKSSPSRNASVRNKSSTSETAKHAPNGASDEQWIDGPRISKSKVAEARHLMKEPCHVKKRETWIDGPMQEEISAGYGYMDSHKKNMIRKWVEHQTSQIQKKTGTHGKPADPKLSKESTKELTQFKTCDGEVVKPAGTSKQQPIEESTIRTGLKLAAGKNSDVIQECEGEETYETQREEEQEDEDETVEIPPALPLIQPLSSREVSLESLDNLLKERLSSNPNYSSQNQYQGNEYGEHLGSDDEILEIIEVEEPLEPVPTQDCCLQVTEEDIAFCMGILENPLPEVDQENPLDHPLRILSQENLTVVSTFTDSMSVYTDLERILPRNRYDPKYNPYNNDYEDPENPRPGRFDETNRFPQLYPVYSNPISKVNPSPLEFIQNRRFDQKQFNRSESMSLSDMLYGIGGVGAHETSSIYSEPAYIPDQEKFCENCKVSMSRPATAQHWYADPYLSASSTELVMPFVDVPSLGPRFQRYSHKYKDNLAYLRHPDGASNPNLKEENERLTNNGTFLSHKMCNVSTILTETAKTTRPLTPPNSLPSTERINPKITSVEAGLTSIKLNQKTEEYDSGHDSTPRTSKHSPAAISRRAESGYDSVVRDSESSSIDSEPTRLSHSAHGKRGKCKHKHDKSFCSWFLHPFTCKYIDEPPETHF